MTSFRDENSYKFPHVSAAGKQQCSTQDARLRERHKYTAPTDEDERAAPTDECGCQSSQKFEVEARYSSLSCSGCSDDLDTTSWPPLRRRWRHTASDSPYKVPGTKDHVDPKSVLHNCTSIINDGSSTSDTIHPHECQSDPSRSSHATHSHITNSSSCNDFSKKCYSSHVDSRNSRIRTSSFFVTSRRHALHSSKSPRFTTWSTWHHVFRIFSCLTAFVVLLMCSSPVRCSGRLLTTSNDSCLSSPCFNNGTCTWLGKELFWCNCSDVMDNYDMCHDNVTSSCDSCPTNSTCVPVETDNTTTSESYNCSCPVGFTGTYCETARNCSTQPCFHNATCLQSTNSLNFSCFCDYGWTGHLCESIIDECQLNSSLCGHGICHASPGGYTCDCNGTGYEGLHCNVDINECNVTSLCRHNGTCTNTPGNFTCNCTLGYVGSLCTTPDCGHVTCQNGGNCTTNSDIWRCNCPPHISGELCEIVTPCASNPCLNGATCHVINSTSYDCKCQTGFTGHNCNTSTNICVADNPCRNGATCSSWDEYGTYNCSCTDDFLGQTCHLANPCSNSSLVCHDRACQPVIGEGEVNVTAVCTCNNGRTEPCSSNSSSEIGLIVGLVVGFVVLILVIAAIVFFVIAKGKRATGGTYHPGREEMVVPRFDFGNALKVPPEERLI